MNGDYDRSFDALRRADGESEARAKIARLFPQGRPQASDNEAVVASFQPMSAESAQPAPVDGAEATSPASQPAATTAASTPPSANPRGLSGRVPDSEINDRFAAIDHETEPVPRSTSAAPAPATNWPQAATTANGFNSAPVQAAPAADPMASMPLWSPGGSSSQTRKTPAAFEFGDTPSTQAQTADSQRPRVVATDITPAEDTSKSPSILSRRDALARV